MLVYKNASFSSCISQKWPLWVKKLLLKKFFVALFFRVTPQATGAPDDCMKNGISIFSNIVVSALSGKLISSRSRKRLEMGSEKAPETLQRSTKVQRFIYVYIYTYVSICA